MSDTFSITNTTKGKLPRLPFAAMKDFVLGGRYFLSLAFIGDRRSKRLNMTYRHKGYSPNILSFPLGPNSGEIFINPSRAAREAKRFGRTPEKFIGYLFIHGLLHLKGLTHGSKMESKERAVRDRFDI